MTHKISNDGTTAVDPDYYWRSVESAPRGVSIWLLTRHGVGVTGQYTGQSDIVGWCPKPKVPKYIKELLK